jgi:hypothetical protein
MRRISGLRDLHAACRARQLRPVQAKLFASPTDDPRIEGLLGPSEGHLGLLSLPMHGHRDGTFMPALLLAIEAEPTIGKPFSECGTFQ